MDAQRKAKREMGDFVEGVSLQAGQAWKTEVETD